VDEVMLFWGLGLLAASLLLIVVEVFVPSMGVIAIVAAACAVAGVICMFRVSLGWGVASLATVAVLGPMAFGFALKVWPSTPIGRAMLGEPTPEEAEAARQAAMKERDALLALVGAEGKVLTDLRPVGVVEIDGRRYEALSESSLIRAGARVRVTVIEGSRMKVRSLS
jgi:membrane-bound ClpP family serine protease